MPQVNDSTLIFGTAALAGIVVFLLVVRNGKKKTGKPLPPTLPVIPMFKAFFGAGFSSLPGHFMKASETLGPVVSFSAAGKLTVVFNSNDVIFEAMMKRAEAFADRTDLWQEINLANPDLRGVIFCKYDETFKKYQKVALVILKEFGFGQAGPSETRILQEAEGLVAKIRIQNGRPFHPYALFSFYASSVVYNFLFGKKFLTTNEEHHRNIIDKSNESVASMDYTVNVAPIVRFLPFYRRKNAEFAEYTQQLMNSIDIAIKYNIEEESEDTFIRRFIQIEGPNYNREDLRFILRDMCLASTETVPQTLQWGMIELANNPDVKVRLQNEIDENVPKHRLPSLDDKARLPYLDAVTLEIMRKRTIVPLAVAHATLKDTEVAGYFVPKGSMILNNLYGIHMDPKVWNDPQNFRPERFLDEANGPHLRKLVIPFSLGKRACLGEVLARQELFLFLVILLQNFDILPPEGQNEIRVDEIFAGTVHPTDFEILLIPRQVQ